MTEIRKKALDQAQRASAEDWENIFFAMRVVIEITKHARHNGILSLPKKESFQDGMPYILDVTEEKFGHPVPLKRYLSFGIESISWGTDRVEELMANRCLASSHSGMDLLTSWIYASGVKAVQFGSNYHYMLKYFWSVIPDSMESKFREFIRKLWEDYPEIKQMRKAQKAFEEDGRKGTGSI